MGPLIGLAVLAAAVFFALKHAFDRTGLTPVAKAGGNAVWQFFSPLSFLRRNHGAKWQGALGTWRSINPSNDGLVVDGDRGRITADASFSHVVLVAPTGAGKTTKYIIPNALQLENCSMVVTDPSGEIWEKTSGSLRARGFDVVVLDLANPARSVRYNPLAKVRTPMQAATAAKVLVKSGGTHGKDDAFWNNGAETLLDVLIQCLCAKADPKHLNLHNLLYLLQHFGQDGSDLDLFVIRHAPRPAHNMWKGVTSGSEKVTQSYVSTAIAALRMLNIPDLAGVLSEDGLDFRSFRRRKTALFVHAPPQDIELYAFVLNLLHTQAFATWMERRPSSGDLPVYVLADEFGHSSIPGFSATIANIRKHEVSISMVLQSLSQLEEHYGRNAADTIIEGGVGSRMVYGGADTRTTGWVQSMLGKMVFREYDAAGPVRHREENLMNADRVRTLGDRQAVYVFRNREAALLNTVPWYDNPRLARLAALPPHNPCAGSAAPELDYVDLSQYRR